MHDKASRTARVSFLKEARIMRKLDHPSIVHIYGIVTDETPLLILMELCEGLFTTLPDNSFIQSYWK